MAITPLTGIVHVYEFYVGGVDEDVFERSSSTPKIAVVAFEVLDNGEDCPKTHKLESPNFQFTTDDSTFSQLRSCFDSVCRIKQQNHDTIV